MLPCALTISLPVENRVNRVLYKAIGRIQFRGRQRRFQVRTREISEEQTRRYLLTPQIALRFRAEPFYLRDVFNDGLMELRTSTPYNNASESKVLGKV